MELQREFDDLAKGDRQICKRGETVPLDMLDRLCLDPGSRTLGELIQEREWALGEIRRLRVDVSRLSRKKEAFRIETDLVHAKIADGKHLDPALNAQRLIRPKDLVTMLGIGRSTLYKYVREGSFPPRSKLGFEVCGGSLRIFSLGELTLTSSRCVKAKLRQECRKYVES